MDEKLKKLEHQKKMFEDKKKILEDKIINNVGFCQVILKTGAKKGSECGSKIHQDNLCKRHTPKQQTIFV